MTGDQFKALRISLGLTQTGIADQLGTDKFTVSKWESGRHKISKVYQNIIQEKYKEQLKQIITHKP